MTEKTPKRSKYGHYGKYEVLFSEGLERHERCNRDNLFIYPEEIVDKKCGGCVRCKPRDRKGETGFHCTMRNYDIEVPPEHKACVSYWDKAEYERAEQQYQEDEENRRKELWAIYAEREPIKLPIVNDGYGMIPDCPICGEMPYSLEQCHWCGQRFIQDEEVKEYAKPDEGVMDCFHCGGKNTVHYIRSKYNGHKHGSCSKCGMSFME